MGPPAGLYLGLKSYNDLLVAVNQGGKRPGAGCAYLEPWHLDIEEFLDLKKEYRGRAAAMSRFEYRKLAP